MAVTAGIEQATASCNEVHLIGKLAKVPDERVLPSGDVLTLWSVVVSRAPRATREGVRSQTVDTIACVTRSAAVRRASASWQAGDVLELHGSLHRRFWRAPSGPASRYEVEITKARRLARGS